MNKQKKLLTEIMEADARDGLYKTNNMAQQTDNYPKDRNGQIVKVGDKVKGFGCLKFQDGFEIDRTPIVTANLQNGILYFGNLSAKSFTDGFEIVKNK